MPSREKRRGRRDKISEIRRKDNSRGKRKHDSYHSQEGRKGREKKVSLPLRGDRNCEGMLGKVRKGLRLSSVNGEKKGEKKGREILTVREREKNERQAGV